MVRSPGRINLIGEHTDYNDGFVLPAAIDRQICFAIATCAGKRSTLVAANNGERHSFHQDDLGGAEKPWANYLLGVVDQLRRRGLVLSPFNCVFGGDIPIGAGLSSSAALTCGLAFALNEIGGFKLDRHELARIAQDAEREFAGVQCGIMDQFANLFGQEHSVLKLDCRSLAHEIIPLAMDDVRLVLCNSGVSHALASSQYNQRRLECEAGGRALQKHDRTIRALRDVKLEQLQEFRSEMEATVLRRCQFVLQENQRVHAAAAALAARDADLLGDLMDKSHAGLRDDYEVSCREIDFLVEVARDIKGVLGARMMGGGFGGCTLNLVRSDACAAFERILKSKYKQETGIEPEVFQVSLTKGTSILT